MDASISGHDSIERPRIHGHPAWIAPVAVLILVTLLVFGGTVRNGFVVWDDEANITASPYMQPVTANSIIRQWREPYFAMYIPVTRTVWSGIGALAAAPKDAGGRVTYNPRWFHAANLMVHLTNVLLVFALIWRLVRQEWASVAGALLFAIHPTQVEPVAWVTGMKDLLGTSLMLAAALQYMRAGEGGRRPYALATILYILSLLAKPSAAALPLILLALDSGMLKRPLGRSARLLLPWVVLAIPVMLITRSAEAATGAVPAIPLWERPLIAGDTYAWYLRKLVWPGATAVDYGRSPDVVLHSVFTYAAWVVSVVVGMAAWRVRRRFPAMLAGFAIFIAAILPVSGLTPFAFQSISDVADRYNYLAMLGPSLATAAYVARCRWKPAAGFAGVVLAGLACSTLASTRQWIDSETLLQHTIAVNPQSWMAWNNLAVVRERTGDTRAAADYYRRALSVNPACFMAHNNLGMILEREGKMDEAAVHFGAAVRANPMYAESHFNHGRMLARSGDRLGAAKEFKRAVTLDGGYVVAYNNLGAMLTLLGRPEDARACFLKAVEIDPRCADALFNLGVNYLQVGRCSDAARPLSEAVRLQPANTQAKHALADAIAMLDRQARR